MTITVTKGELFDSGAELLVLPVFGNGDFDVQFLKGLDETFKKRVAKAAKSLEFSGKAGQSLLLPVPAGASADELLLVGLGDKKREALAFSLREASGVAVMTAKRRGLRTIAIDLSAKDFKEEAAEAVVTAALLADYTFETYKKGNPARK
ncbi:MAG: M17 family peptidase N-terminal domain-containing protein, partial [Patescibacteria group bacterium]